MSVLASSGSQEPTASAKGRFQSEQGLRNLIDNQIHENVSLEYKSGSLAEDKNGRSETLAKEVSAFANSQGGTLLIGIKTRKETGRGSERTELPDAIDGVDRSLLSRETINNILISNIQPKIPDIEIDEIPLSADLDGKVVYQITVPVSRFAPHMVSNTYYKRTSTATIPMEHYEVEDVRHRRVGTDLTVEMSLTREIQSNVQGQDLWRLQFVMRNSSETPAQFALLRVYLDSQTRIVDPASFERLPLTSLHSLHIAQELFVPGTEMLVYKVNAYSGSMPLWNALPFSAGRGALVNLGYAGPEVIQRPHTVVWRIDSPNMNPRLGVNRIVRIDGVARVEGLEVDRTALAQIFS